EGRPDPGHPDQQRPHHPDRRRRAPATEPSDPGFRFVRLQPGILRTPPEPPMPSLPDLVTPIDQAPPGSGPALFLEFARRGKPGGWRYAVVILAGLVLAIVLGAVLALALAWTGLLGPQGLGALQL